MIHIYRKGHSKNTLLMLHGTGGDEKDLLDLATLIDEEANVLSIRGNVNENGLNRFFERISPGLFNLKDLTKRSLELYDFLEDASKEYGFSLTDIIAVGYSNGANIAVNILYEVKEAFKGAILLRPVVPRRDIEPVRIDGTNVYISSGRFDNLSPIEESAELADTLSRYGAKVKLEWQNAGHEISYNEFGKIKEWYKQIK